MRSNGIQIPERNLDLEKLGLVNQDLFHVEGELAVRYNKILKEIFSYECDIDHFRIDKRGTSPEIGKFLAKKYDEKNIAADNYLTIGSANPYMIVISPDQKSAPLIMPHASYEDKLYDTIYQAARHTIEDITAGEGMFGMIDNRITVYRSVEDLFNLRTLSVNLDTLQETSSSIAQLKEMMDKLGEKDKKVSYFGLENAINPKYIERIRGLVEKVGNVEARAVSDIFPIKTEVHCFYAEFYGGVHCLRNFKNNDDIKGIFITNGHKNVKDLGEEITEIDIRDEKLLDLLHRYRFMKYDSSLIEQRMSEIEDEVLLSKDHDLVSMNGHKRTQLVCDHHERMPKCWHELSDIRRAFNGTSVKLSELMKDFSYETKLKLSVSATKKEIINHMLAELDPSDSLRVYEFNKRKFVSEFSQMPVNRQRYIVKKILEMKGGNI